MEKNNKFTLSLPNNVNGFSEIETSNSLLFIGANGSGKTRLGTWVEFNSPQKEKVHRISAQKSLAMPDSTTPRSIDEAVSDLLFGYPDAINQSSPSSYKHTNRWQRKPANTMLNDFQKLMVYLFSDHTEESAKYLAESKMSNERVAPPITKLDRVKEVWEKILPHRELVLGGLRIQTKVKNDAASVYNSSEMSDGERVIFYLIGQCLSAPTDGIIVIDEPELHLHKSVQAPLWAEIERQRPDCLFVYLTHDVDFAASFKDSKKVWLKSFDGNTWDWDIVQEIDNLPEELLIEILGSRKPIVFVEGETGSHDTTLYRMLLDDYLVIPRGSCSQVIESTKALRNSQQLHHLSVYGIIDRDRRVDDEIASLEEYGVYTLKVAEVENLFCTEEILALISDRLVRNKEDDFSEIRSFIMSRLKAELENQISLRSVSEIKFRLNLFDDKAKGIDGLETALVGLTSSIDVKFIYKQNESLFEQIISTSDYKLLLKVYNRKSLPKQIAQKVGLKNDELPEFVIRMAKSGLVVEVKRALKPYFGGFSKYMA